MFTQRLTHKCSYKIYIIAKKLGKKDSRCPSADDWINKLLYIHSMAHLLLFFFLSLISFLIILQYISFCSCFKVIADSIIFVNSVLFLLSDFFFCLLVKRFCFYTCVVNFYQMLNSGSFTLWTTGFSLIFQSGELCFDRQLIYFWNSLIPWRSDFKLCYDNSTSEIALLLRHDPSGIFTDCPGFPTWTLHPELKYLPSL